MSAARVKQTRKIMISEKVFTAEDLRRIAGIFEKQRMLASKSDHRASLKYNVELSDHTTLETDSPELFTNESLATPARPIAVGMSFDNYTLGRHMKLHLTHGEDSDFTNLAVVSGEEAAWLKENFVDIKEAVEKVQPQALWFRRHRFFLLSLISLGLGSLAMMISGYLLVPVLAALRVPPLISPDSPWLQALRPSSPTAQFLLYWFWCWLIGFFFRARDVLWWLLDMWPGIEFRFGLAHLQSEQIRRRRLGAVATLIILPICTNLIASLIIWR
jgi:hypothetical protein